ncbi:MAG: hypothetical protein QOE43_2063 [Gaiellaceae bacterium]|jgi:hypothetical protein|nr:hypothetical protein [Gaiellaceae bacterium]
MNDWDTLRPPLEAALEAPEDEEAIKHAVDAAELVASAAGEPPDELPEAAREWVERHGVPPEDLVELAVRSMKQVANTNEWWRERINDLRYRLGDIAAPYQP